MKKATLTISFLLLTVAIAVPVFGKQPPTDRLAVVDVEISSRGWSCRYSGGRQAWIVDRVSSEFAKAGWTVVERRRLDSIIREQNLGASGRVDPRTAPSTGKLYGASKLVQVIVRIELNHSRINTDGTRLEIVTAKVTINGHLNDTETGVIFPAKTVKAEEWRPRNVSFGGWRGMNFASSNPGDEAVNRAADRAVARFVKQITTAYPQTLLPATDLGLAPKTPQFLYLAPKKQVYEGDCFGIWRNGKMIAEVEVAEICQDGRAYCKVLRSSVANLGQSGDTAKTLTPTIPVE